MIIRVVKSGRKWNRMVAKWFGCMKTGKIKRLIEKYKDTLLKENILTEERLKRIGIEI